METNKDVPKEALRFVGSTVEFGDNGTGTKTAPVKIVARSGKPIEHWFWGRVVHDLEGMRLDKPKLPIDYVHDDYEVLGYLNKFDTESGDLVCSGAITPFDEKDRAAEVLYKQQIGVPYEASINFDGDGIKIQELAVGEVAAVNGYQFEGPGIIIREWPLRGVAICPYGADAHTSTQFKNDKSETRKINLFRQENSPMSTKLTAEGTPQQQQPQQPVEADKDKDKDQPQGTPTPEAPKPGAVEGDTGKPAEGEPATPPVDAATSKLKAGQPGHDAYIKAFGDKGARWFLEGKSFPDATAEFVASLNTEHKAEVESLKQRIDAQKLGNDPVKFQAATEPGDKQQPPPNGAPAQDPKLLSSKVGDNIARVAGAIKLPAAKPQV